MQTLDALTTSLVQTPRMSLQQSRTPAPTTPRRGRGLQNAVPPWDLRWPLWRSFGDCVSEAGNGGGGGGGGGSGSWRKCGSLRGATVVAGAPGAAGEAKGTFVAGRPRRHLSPPPLGSYLVVERLLLGCGLDGLDTSEPRWTTVATDDDLSTAVEWTAVGPLALGSRLTLSWRPPVGTSPGCYRLGVKGAAKGIRRWLRGKDVAFYHGYTSNFFVTGAAAARGRPQPSSTHTITATDWLERD